MIFIVVIFICKLNKNWEPMTSLLGIAYSEQFLYIIIIKIGSLWQVYLTKDYSGQFLYITIIKIGSL